MNRALSLILFAFAFGLGHARDIDEVVDVVTGTLYAFDPQTGENSHLVNPIHLNAINSSFVHYLRLDLGSKYGVIDMELTQDSVWSKHSVMVARYGDEAKEVPNAVDNECYVSGDLLSHKGAVSFQRCGTFHGIIHADTAHYMLETIGDSNSDSKPLPLRVTIMKSEKGTMGNDAIGSQLPEEDQITSATRTMAKRDASSPTVETSVTVDAYYIRHMRNKFRFTTQRLQQHIILKWNTIRRLYNNAADLGVPFNFVLKKLEFWYENPSYYAVVSESSKDQLEFLKAFCRNDRSKRFDLRMLYSMDVGDDGVLGMAYWNRVCGGNGEECAVNKSPTTNVKVELHEIGHLLGLRHDSMMEGCRKVNGKGGVMGIDNMDYMFIPCYKPILRQTAQKQCLHRVDVPDPVVPT